MGFMEIKKPLLFLVQMLRVIHQRMNDNNEKKRDTRKGIFNALQMGSMYCMSNNTFGDWSAFKYQSIHLINTTSC